MDQTKYDQLKQVIKQAGGSDRYSLADVLLAISNDGNGGIPARLGQFGYEQLMIEARGNNCLWNLKDDSLDHQSEETKSFLTKLRCN